MEQLISAATRLLPGKWARRARAGISIYKALLQNADEQTVDKFVNKLIDGAAEGGLSKSDIMSAVNTLALPDKG